MFPFDESDPCPGGNSSGRKVEQHMVRHGVVADRFNGNPVQAHLVAGPGWRNWIEIVPERDDPSASKRALISGSATTSWPVSRSARTKNWRQPSAIYGTTRRCLFPLTVFVSPEDLSFCRSGWNTPGDAAEDADDCEVEEPDLQIARWLLRIHYLLFTRRAETGNRASDHLRLQRIIDLPTLLGIHAWLGRSGGRVPIYVADRDGTQTGESWLSAELRKQGKLTFSSFIAAASSSGQRWATTRITARGNQQRSADIQGVFRGAADGHVRFSSSEMLSMESDEYGSVVDKRILSATIFPISNIKKRGLSYDARDDDWRFWRSVDSLLRRDSASVFAAGLCLMCKRPDHGVVDRGAGVAFSFALWLKLNGHDCSRFRPPRISVFAAPP